MSRKTLTIALLTALLFTVALVAYYSTPLYLFYLRKGDAVAVQEEASPDNAFLVRIVVLKSGSRSSLLFNTDISDVYVIDKASNQVLNRGTIFGWSVIHMPIDWVSCEKMPANERPNSWSSEETCYVRWAWATENLNNSNQKNYSFYLRPPATAVLSYSM